MLSFNKELRQAYQALSILQRELREEKDKNTYLTEQLLMKPVTSDSDLESENQMTDANFPWKQRALMLEKKLHSTTIQREQDEELDKSFQEKAASRIALDNQHYSQSNPATVSESDSDYHSESALSTGLSYSEVWNLYQEMKVRSDSDKEQADERVNVMQQQLLQSEYTKIKLREEKAALALENDCLRSKSDAIRCQYEMVQSDLETYQLRWVMKFDERERDRMWQYRAQISELKQKNSYFIEMNTGMKAQLMSKQKECNTYRRESDRLHLILEDRRDWLKLFQDLHHYRNDYEQLDTKLQETLTKTRTLDSLKTKLTYDLHQSKARTLSEKRNFLTQSAKWQTQKDQYEMQLEDAHTIIHHQLQRIQNLQNSISPLQIQLDKILAANSQLELEIGTLNLDRDRIEFEWKERWNLENARANSSLLRLQRFEKQMEEAMDEMKFMMRANSELKASSKMLEDKCHELTKKNDLILSELKEVESESEELRSQYIDVTEREDRYWTGIDRQTRYLELQLMNSQDDWLRAYDTVGSHSSNIDFDNTRRFLPQYVELCECTLNALKICLESDAIFDHGLHHEEIHVRETFAQHLSDLFTSQVNWKEEELFVALQKRKEVLSCLLSFLREWRNVSVYPHENEAIIPAPSFGITSHECFLILQNWTTDSKLQIRTQQWLYTVASLSYPRVYQISQTLHLDHMTKEVKDAFLMLILPILRQNTAIYITCHTRQIVTDNVSDMSWDMKITIQDPIQIRKEELQAQSDALWVRSSDKREKRQSFSSSDVDLCSPMRLETALAELESETGSATLKESVGLNKYEKRKVNNMFEVIEARLKQMQSGKRL